MAIFSKRDVLVLALTIIGAASGLALSLARQSTWQPLGKLPAIPYRIQAATRDIVFIRTDGGQVYAFRDEVQSYGNGGSPQGHWTTELPETYRWEFEECARDKVVLPQDRPPLPILDSYSCWVSVEQSRLGLMYAILEDGSVWRWSTPLWPHGLTGPLSLGIMGALCGCLLAVGLLRLVQALQWLLAPGVQARS